MSETKEPTKTRGNWNATNIISVVVGIIIFWPLGLFLLIWVLMDRDVVEIGHMIRKEWRNLMAKLPSMPAFKSKTGNSVFDEYQQTQMDRIKEIKKEVHERKAAFSAYKQKRDRQTEQTEFEDFMKRPAGEPQESKAPAE